MLGDDFDAQAESVMFPWIDGSVDPDNDPENEENYDSSEDMDGDHESALASAGFGTDEDYGHYGGDDDY